MNNTTKLIGSTNLSNKFVQNKLASMSLLKNISTTEVSKDASVKDMGAKEAVSTNMVCADGVTKKAMKDYKATNYKATKKFKNIMPKSKFLISSNKPVEAVTEAVSFSKLHQKYLEQQWKLTTGIAPEKSTFILATPIYNEERMGLGCIQLASTQSNIPLLANVWHLYVTNRCTDNSQEMILDHLKSLGQVTTHSINELGDFTFDQNIDQHYNMVTVGNHKHIHINTETGSKANVWRILTAIGKLNNIKIIMSYDTNVCVLADGPMKLFREAYQSFILNNDDAVIISAKTEEYIDQDLLDSSLKSTKLSPRQVLPFGLLVPEQHRVNGKFAAWNADFYYDKEIPLCKLDDIVMAKQAERYGKQFKHIDEVLSYEWGVPTLNGRQNMLKRFTIGYLQMVNHLKLRALCPEIKFFEDNEYRHEILKKHLNNNANLDNMHELTHDYWDEAVKAGYQEFQNDPLNPAFEAIEGSK